jgi:RNA polymerase sigma-70 factor (ECF subfamily)
MQDHSRQARWPRPLEEFRSYLGLLARAELHQAVRRRIDASDVVQETLLEAHRDRAGFRGETPAEQAAWLRRMLANNLANALRDARRLKRDPARERSLDEPVDRDALDRSELRMKGWLASEGTTPPEAAERGERILALARSLEGLPPDQQEAVTLRYLRGLSLAEIADRMERTEASVAGLLHRGLRDLRGRLGTEVGP